MYPSPAMAVLTLALLCLEFLGDLWEHRRRVSWSGSGLVVLAGVGGLPGVDLWQGIGHRGFLGQGPGQLRQGTIWADSGAGDWPNWLWEGSWDRWSKGSDFILS